MRLIHGGVTARLLLLGAAHTKGNELVSVDLDNTLISDDVIQPDLWRRTCAEGAPWACCGVMQRIGEPG